MKPPYYQEFSCRRCGWAICAFIGSDMEQRYQRSHVYPNCPYCKIRGTGCYSMTDIGPEMHTLREPMNSRPAIPKRLREEILEEYEGKCVICGSTDHVQIDHIIPAVDYGTIEPENLQVLCRSCNASKGNGSGITEMRKTILAARRRKEKQRRWKEEHYHRTQGEIYADFLAAVERDGN